MQKIIDFVEGRIEPYDFERIIQNESHYETLLDDSTQLPKNSYIETNTYYYIIEQNYNDPGDILNIHGALCQFLDHQKVQYQATKKYSDLLNLILDVQPKYLDIDTFFLKKYLLEKAPELSKNEQKKWLKEQIKTLFKYIQKPPIWIQNPQWPIDDNQPLVFLGQLKVTNYFHDETQIYIFHNQKTNKYKNIIQTY